MLQFCCDLISLYSLTSEYHCILLGGKTDKDKEKPVNRSGRLTLKTTDHCSLFSDKCQ